LNDAARKVKTKYILSNQFGQRLGWDKHNSKKPDSGKKWGNRNGDLAEEGGGFREQNKGAGEKEQIQ